MQMTRPSLAINESVDYSRYLKLHNVKFKDNEEYYYQVGSVDGKNGWRLSVTSVKPQFTSLLQQLLPILVKRRASFKLIKNASMLSQLLAGNLGYEHIGRCIIIYPSSPDESAALAEELSPKTAEFRGPCIPTDVQLSNIIYTSYCESYSDHAESNQGNINHGSWPFTKLVVAPSKARSPSFILNNRYLLLKTLKSDAKGNVYKAFRVNVFNIRTCVIKEGNHDICFDDAGRDVTDRLLWQYKALTELARYMNVPKVFETFSHNGKMYLSMELLEGVPISDQLDKIYQGRTWLDLAAAERRSIISIVLRLTEQIKRIHTKGYIHRDIAPGNFLIRRDGQVFLIDLELSYHISDKYPFPPFEYGTVGFTSPEQERGEIPTVAADVYGLGALIVQCITNVSPTRFKDSGVSLQQNIDFFTNNDRLSAFVATCLSKQPNDRPSVQDIINFFDFESAQISNLEQTAPQNVFSATLEKTHINTCLNSFSNVFANEAGHWFSNSRKDSNQISNRQLTRAVRHGLYDGIAGIVYCLATTKLAGYKIDSLRKTITTNIRVLVESYLRNKAQTYDTGLYNGAAGILYALNSANTVIEPIQTTALNQLRRLTEEGNNCLDLASGIAGKGLVLIKIDSIESRKNNALGNFIDEILFAQAKDGRWNNEGECYYGISCGSAGIILFLLHYYYLTKDQGVVAAITDGLNFLVKRSKYNGTGTSWPVGNKRNEISPWFGDGITGIAYVFLKAFQALNDRNYLTTALRALHFHPHRLTVNSLSFANGLAGIGEVYLEAFKLTADDRWYERATWIAETILRTAMDKQDGARWISEPGLFPTGDLFTGNAGIVHFLLRHIDPAEAKFPVFDFK